MQKYYDGTKLLSMLDINGNKPEIYISTANRSAGKTTYFNRYLVNRFLKYGEKFCLVYRYSYELDGVTEKFFKDIKTLFFNGYEMTSKKRSKGAYCELSLNEVPCGYAVAINTADQIKKHSHLLNDVCRMLMDEFQSETNHYCSNEIQKLISIHTSIARGNGEQVRYVPMFLISNAVSLINPYYVELGISERLDEKTNFLKGDGFVLEQGYVEAASIAQQSSAFNRAFKQNSYVQYASQNVYLNDNKAFIEKLSGKCSYVATIKYCGVEYGVREYYEQGVVYCDTSADTKYKLKISVTTEDHNINYVMLNKSDNIIQIFRYFFEKGCFRFKNLKCKQAILALISY